MFAGWGALAVLAGVALGYGMAAGTITLPAGGVVVIGLAAVVAVWWSSRSATLGLALGLVLAASLARGAAATPALTLGDVAFYAGRAVTLTGTIDAEPDVRDGATFVVVTAQSLAASGQAPRPVHGLLEVRYGGTPAVEYGDVLQLRGHLQSTLALAGAGYGAYLRARGIGVLMTYPRLSRVARDSGNPIEAAILRLRLLIESTIAGMLPQPEASLLAALLIGGHSAALGSVAGAFVNAGMIHVVAISGLKVALVVGLIYRLATACWGWRWAYLPTLPATAAYVALTGGTPAGIRAGLMWAMVLLAQRVGRRSHALTSLALTAAAMSLLTPSLVADLGFQMSVLGTAGVAGLSYPLEARLHRLPPILREGLAVTLAAQVATVPVVAGAFGQISLIGPLANALCLPLMVVAMAAGAAGTLVALALPAMAHAAGYLAYAVLWAMVTVVSALGAAPAASAGTPAFTLVAAGAYYFLLLLCCWAFLPGAPRPDVVARFWPGASTPPPRPSPSMPLRLTAALGAGSALIAAGWQAPVSQLYHVSLLSTGHGQVVVLQTPRGQVMVVDGGDGPAALQQALGAVLPFWRRTLTLVVVSAVDRAHVGGLLGVTTAYRVASAADGGSFYPSASYALWRAELRRALVPHLLLHRGERLTLDRTTALDVLAPQSRDPAATAWPAAYRLWIGRVSLLLVNREALSLPPQTWRGDASPTGQSAGRDTIVVLPAVPQRGNAAWRLLAATRPALAALPSARDATALADQTTPVALPAAIQTWQGQGSNRLDLLTDGQGYSLQAQP